MSIAIITGASSGMGQEFVKQILKQDADLSELWIISRRRDRLEAMTALAKNKIKIFALDLTETASLDVLKKELLEQKPNIKILVNAAGYGKIGDFQSVAEKDNIGMLDLNCKALVACCYACLPYMSRKSQIINISSVAAFLPQPHFAIYAASKAFVLSFSRALNQELKKQGISVTAVCPNPMKTEFFEIAGTKQQSSSIKNIGIEEVDHAVAVALKNARKGKDRSLSCFMAKAIHVLAKILPHRFIFFIERKIGL